MIISESSSTFLEEVHKKSNWVICIDMGIDKKIISNNNESNNKIIGFTTGEGPFGEYNVTISSKPETLHDIKRKLTSRLKKLFYKWDKEVLLPQKVVLIGQKI